MHEQNDLFVIEEEEGTHLRWNMETDDSLRVIYKKCQHWLKQQYAVERKLAMYADECEKQIRR